MRRYGQISRWLLCLVTLSVVIAVVSIPLISATHIHMHHGDGCDERRGDAAGTDGAPDCDFCALYAQFTPGEALPAPSFCFRAPVTPLRAVFAQPQPKALCKGLLNGHTTRGPPVFFA